MHNYLIYRVKSHSHVFSTWLINEMIINKMVHVMWQRMKKMIINDFDFGMASYQYSDQVVEDENKVNMAEDEEEEDEDIVNENWDSMDFVHNDIEVHIT